MATIDESAYVAPGARILGNVSLGKNVGVWHNAVLRGDYAGIVVEDGANVQDCSVVHGGHEEPAVIGGGTTVGHAAVVHACRIGADCLVGMNATVLDDADIGDYSIVGAGAVVAPGKQIPPRSLVVGVPGKVVRNVSDEEIEGIKENCKRYVQLAKSYKQRDE